MSTYHNLLLCLILVTESVVISYILKGAMHAAADYEMQMRAARSGIKAGRGMSR